MNPAGPISGRRDAPGSKSHTNRALIVAGLAAGPSRLERPLVADDVEHMIAGLSALGVRITPDGLDVEVAGSAGDLSDSEVVIDAGLSGTTMRFLTAVATLTRGQVTLTGEPPLLARPLRPLVDALDALGCQVVTSDGHAPVVVRPGRPRGGPVRVDATQSSQFASAVLLIAPFAERDVHLTAPGLGAAGYVRMTVELMSRFGADATWHDDVIAVCGGTGYEGRTERIDGDASAAAHLFAVAAATGGELTVGNIGGAEGQPDWGFLDVLGQMGAEWWVGDDRDAVTVRAPERLAPIDVDLATMPDQLPSAAVLAALADGRSILTGLGVTRGHETDRIAAVAAELSKLGIATETGPDWIAIDGGRPQGPALIATHDDHRMAMAFAVLGLGTEGIVIEGAESVAKTFPDFFETLDLLRSQPKSS